MKIHKEEYQNWLDNNMDKNNFDWMNINTSPIEKMSDNDLLGQLTTLRLFCGYGLVAELCKRFNER